MAGDDDEMFMTRSFNVTPKTTEQHLIVRRDKRVQPTFCTFEANYMTDAKHRAASLRQQSYMYSSRYYKLLISHLIIIR